MSFCVENNDIATFTHIMTLYLTTQCLTLTGTGSPVCKLQNTHKITQINYPVVLAILR